MLETYLAKDNNELVSLAKDAYSRIMPFCKKLYNNEKDGVIVLFTFIITAVGADCELTPRERAFLREVIKVSDELIIKCVNAFNPKMDTLADTLFDNFPTDVRKDLLTFILCVLASDGVTREETEFLRILLA
ncbi:MAG: hypothetical protein E7660_03585 [Ruminococcaceae bacterium]|nr:hypothetical protein [Oscillospiraceae bacterium]